MGAFFTGCNHFLHPNIIKYCFRPFNNVKEQDETMILNWNGVVTKDDTVFVLGDIAMTNNVMALNDILNRLNGRIVLIKGDHDQVAVKECSSRFESIHSFYRFSIGDRLEMSLFHWPMLTWPKSHYNSYSLYSHHHGSLESKRGNVLPGGKCFDVGVDCNNFTPLSLKEVLKRMELKPDNFNLIKPEQEKKDLKQISMKFTFTKAENIT